MASVSQVARSLKRILEERANVLARETGCIERQRKFSGADLLQTLAFGWLSHPDASLEMLTEVTATREVQVRDTAVHKRFTQSCAQFLHAVLEEMTSVVVTADLEVPVELLRRFEAVVLEESSSIALPDELAACWQGCGGAPGEGRAAVKLHVRWELKRGELQGPCLTHGRVGDRSSPFKEAPLPEGSQTLYWTPDGKRLKLESVLPQRVGQTKELWVRVADEHRHLMRLLILRVVSRSGTAATCRSGGGRQAAAATSAAESLGTGGVDHPAHRCACSPPEFAGSAGAPAGTMANGAALQVVEAIRA